MPFNDTADFLTTKTTYIKALKDEIKRLKPGELGDFYFYDGIPVNGTPESIILLGRVKSAVTKELKKQASVKGVGKCFLEGGTVKMTVTGGKAPEAKVKQVFKDTKNYGYKFVAADMSPAPDGASGAVKLKARFIKARDDYARVKDGLDKASTDTLDKLMGKIETDIGADNPDIAAVTKLVVGFERALTNIEAGNADPDAPPPEKAQALKEFEAVKAKASKIAKALPEDDKKAISTLAKEAATLIKSEDWSTALSKTRELDTALVTRAKAALAAQQAAAKTKGEERDAQLASDPDSVQLQQAVKDRNTKLDAVLKIMSQEMAALEKLRDDLRAENAKDTPDVAELTRIKGEIDTGKKKVATARTAVDKERKSYNIMAAALERRKESTSSALSKEFAETTEKMEALDEMLDSPSFDQAQNELRETVQKMSEAAAWREEKLKAEAGTRDHGTGRHGAQTGLDRQARRAATTEMEMRDGKKKAKRGTGITPDQTGNVAGTAQKEVWNKVEIEYTEEDGRRVVKDRKKVAQAIAGVPSRTSGSDTGSMWANPVLEKEAFDTAMALADGMKDFTHYKKSRGYGDFTEITLVLPPPKSSPGWGYAVKKQDDAAVDPAVAEEILKRFEEGKISLDKLFDEMNVKLLTDADGRNMVRHATCVLKRAGPAGAFSMLTQYPNDQKSATDVGWKPHSSASGSMKFKQNGDAKLWEADLAQVPLSISRTTEDT
ncbi:MAG: hypothetical protein AB8B60_14285 [Sulfitobacter sp.]